MGYNSGLNIINHRLEAFKNGKSEKINVLKRIVIQQGKELFAENDNDFGGQIQDVILNAHNELRKRTNSLMTEFEMYFGSEITEDVRISKKPVRITIRDGKNNDLICTVVLKARLQYFTNMEE